MLRTAKHRFPAARRFMPTVAAILLAGMVAACESTTPLSASSRTDGKGGETEPSFAQFSDVPVPTGAKMDVERSLLLGEREAWIGRLVMTVAAVPSRVYDFYFAEMSKFGWNPITTVRAGTSVLTYSRGDRIATIQISSGTLGGSDISMTVSPRGTRERPAPAPSSGVSSRPLR